MDLPRFRDDGADEERPERDRIFQHGGDQRDRKAEAKRGDEKQLVALELGDVIEKAGHAEEASDQHHGKENGELHQFEAELGGMHLHHARLGESREQGEEDDGEDVLNHEDAEDDLGKALPRFPQLRERLDDDGGGGDGEHRAEEDGVHRTPAEPVDADLVADPDHQRDFHDRRDKRGHAHLGELAQAELQSEGKHEQHHAQFTEAFHDLLVVDEDDGWGVGADNEASEDIAEGDGLFKLVAKESRDARNEHDNG